jgi:hypothetical protein
VCLRRRRDQGAVPSIATFGECIARGILLAQMFLALAGNN